MTTPTYPEALERSSPATLPLEPGPVTLVSVINAEWIKCRTLPSYTMTAVMVLALIVGLGMLNAFSLLSSETLTGDSAHGRTVPYPLSEFLNGMQHAYVVLAVLAAMSLTSEYTQSTIQPSTLSVPMRVPVLAAKMIVMGSAGALVGVLGSLILLVAVPPVLSEAHVVLSDPAEDLTRVVVGSGLSLALMAVFATGLAALIRSLVGTFLTVVVVLTVAPIGLSAVPVEWVARLTVFLPTVAGSQYLAPDPAAALIDPWWGLAVLAVWACAAATAGGLAMRWRDV